MDDWLGNGMRNPAKRWWFDHEIVNGVAVMAKATNERDIDPSRKIDPANQKMAYYHANTMPPPNDPTAHVVDRKTAMAAKELLETPDEARKRMASGGPMPAHYRAAPPVNTEDKREKVASPYD
jgi:hypothetical protein